MALTVGVDSYCDYSTLVGHLVDLGFGSFVDSNDQATIESAARMAVLTMENLVEWRGAKVEKSQALAFPRTGRDASGVAFSGTPAQVVDCEVLLTGAAEGGPLFSTAGACCRNTLGIALWLSGCPDHAAARAEQGMALARRLAHPFTLGIALTFGCYVRLLRRDRPEAERLSRELVELCVGRAFPSTSPRAASSRGRCGRPTARTRRR